jgi:hypothetical protein
MDQLEGGKTKWRIELKEGGKEEEDEDHDEEKEKK